MGDSCVGSRVPGWREVRTCTGSLVARLARIGPAFRGAAKRREWARREQEKREEMRTAHWRAHVMGRGVNRGKFIDQ